MSQTNSSLPSSVAPEALDDISQLSEGATVASRPRPNLVQGGRPANIDLLSFFTRETLLNGRIKAICNFCKKAFEAAKFQATRSSEHLVFQCKMCPDDVKLQVAQKSKSKKMVEFVESALKAQIAFSVPPAASFFGSQPSASSSVASAKK